MEARLEKEISEFKPVKRRLKTDSALHTAQVKGLGRYTETLYFLGVHRCNITYECRHEHVYMCTYVYAGLSVCIRIGAAYIYIYLCRGMDACASVWERDC